MSDEYISREAARKAIFVRVGMCTIGTRLRAAYEEAIDAIDNLPAVDVAPVVHGKWLLDRWPSWPHRECSRCKVMFPRTTEVADQYWQYCPNCGARMDGGDDHAID